MIQQLITLSILGLFLFAGLGIVFGGIAIFRGKSQKGALAESRVSQVFSRRGAEIINDVFVADDDGGKATQIDHIAKLPDKVVVVETKSAEGLIYRSSPEARHWELRSRSGGVFAIENPLLQNEQHIRALRAKIGRSGPVVGLVVYTGHVQFPDGLPNGVMRLDDLDNILGDEMSRPAVAEAEDYWKSAQKAIRVDDEIRRRHAAGLNYLNESNGRRNTGMILIGAGIFVTVAMMVLLRFLIG